MRKLRFIPILRFKAMGIKCDACYWRDDDIDSENYGDWVDKECPVCGENLLTENDYTMVKILMWISKWIGWIRIPTFKAERSTEDVRMQKVLGRWQMKDKDGNVTWMKKT